jgi:hypothetical protein
MVDQTAYPVLFGTAQASWAPIDLCFELLTGEADPTRIARVYVVPFIGAARMVVGFEHGDWGPATDLHTVRGAAMPLPGSSPLSAP